MKTSMKLSLSFSLLVLLAGCSGASAEDPQSTDEALGGTAWHEVLDCHGAVVDADANERRHLQIVVRDPSAVAWLSAHPGAGNAGVPNAKGEIIVDGFAHHGVFAPGDFSGFTRSAYSVADALLPEAHVDRDGGGVKIRLVTWRSGSEVETANWYFPHCR
jgi:hypothetical protein